MTAALPALGGQRAPASDGARPRGARWSDLRVVAALAVLAGASWLPHLGATLSPDEGGYLMVAAQWQDGTSLYGDYWVDRPPGLLWIFALADAAGGAPAVRVLGVVAVVVAVLLAGALGRHVGGRRGALLAAGAAALLLATPLTGAGAVNGEVLGLPLLLAGMLALLRARDAVRAGPAFGWAVATGVAGIAAALVKQSLVDVAVLAAVLLAGDLILRRRPWSRLGPVILGGLLGGAALLGLAVAGAAARGTAPAELWEAVVTFRGEAAGTILESATSSTPARLGRVLLALLGTCVPLLVLALIRASRAARAGRRAADPGTGEVAALRTAACLLLAWELAVVLVSGSYWLHYLIGLTPGLVLLAAATPAPGRALAGRRVLVAGYALSTVSLLVALAVVSLRPYHGPEEQVLRWLQAHAEPGETGLVAFGAPNVLQAAGLSSPYAHLWSLPVRVRDPALSDLRAVLASPRRPDWLVVAGRSVDTWGVSGGEAADAMVAEHYERAGTAGMYTVYRRTEVP